MTLGDFTKQSDAYRQSRPGYPSELLERLITEARVKPGDPVADFGAGTGIMTRMLVDRGFSVTAIEPNEAMRAQSDVPEARWIDGSFERSGLPDKSQRWAIAAQAFHWAEPVKALPEIRRILEKNGLFTVIWNNRSTAENDIVNWTDAAIRRQVPDFDEAYRQKPWQATLESTGDFTFVSQWTVSHVVRMSSDRYLQLWKSHNRLNTLAGPERFAKFFQELSDHLKATSVLEIDVPYNCEAWSARRND